MSENTQMVVGRRLWLPLAIGVFAVVVLAAALFAAQELQGQGAASGGTIASEESADLLDYELEHLFSFTARGGAPQVIGPVPEGLQVNYNVTEGEVWGPRLSGKLLAGGGDWNIMRADGVGIIDVRITFESDDGALIYASYEGVYDLGPDGYDQLAQGQLPSIVPLRIAPRFHTAHPDYVWLNRIQGVGIGQIDTQRLEARYDIYAVR